MNFSIKTGDLSPELEVNSIDLNQTPDDLMDVLAKLEGLHIAVCRSIICNSPSSGLMIMKYHNIARDWTYFGGKGTQS